MGALPLLVEKAPEAAAGDVQCPSGERHRQADVPRRLQTPKLRQPGQRLFTSGSKGRTAGSHISSAADGGTLSFAGLWDRWKNPETGELVMSCTIIVTDANALTRPIHDRMPVVLDQADIGLG